MKKVKTDARTEKVKANLRWMSEHPGEWLWWSWHIYAVSARGVTAPSFERRQISTQGSKDGYGPYKGWKGGLWVRYVGAA